MVPNLQDKGIQSGNFSFSKPAATDSGFGFNNSTVGAAGSIFQGLGSLAGAYMGYQTLQETKKAREQNKQVFNKTNALNIEQFNQQQVGRKATSDKLIASGEARGDDVSSSLARSAKQYAQLDADKYKI